MFSFFNEFNNREIAIAIWISVLLLFVFFSHGFRKSVIGLLKIFFSVKFQVIFLSLCGYVVFCIWLLQKWHLWNFDLLKDAILWFWGVAFPLIFKITGKVNTSVFKTILKDTWKFTIVIEFMVNLYVLSLPAEIVLTFIMIVFSMMQAVTEREEKYAMLHGYILKALGFIGITIAVYSVGKTIVHYAAFFSWSNVQSLLMSPMLTLLYIPLLYILAVIFQYESLFVRIKVIFKSDAAFGRMLKRQIFFAAKLNLNKLSNIASKILKTDLHKVKNIPGYLNAISKSK